MLGLFLPLPLHWLGTAKQANVYIGQVNILVVVIVLFYFLISSVSSINFTGFLFISNINNEYLLQVSIIYPGVRKMPVLFYQIGSDKTFINEYMAICDM